MLAVAKLRIEGVDLLNIGDLRYGDVIALTYPA
jgi:hypothetical protein